MLYEKLFTNHLMCEFKDFQQQKRRAAEEPWHRKTNKGPMAKNQHQVADRYMGRYTGDGEFKFSGELNSKIESIRDGSNQLRVLSPADIQYIKMNYPTGLSRDKPRQLSNSGMIVYWDNVKREWFIRKR